MNFEVPPKRIIPKESVSGDSHTTEWEDNLYDVYKLIHAADSIPTEIVSIESLEKNANNQCWFDESGGRVGPADIFRLAVAQNRGFDPVQLAQEHPELKKILEQVMEADYSHPILVVGDTIIDGMHRYTKARLNGVGVLNIRRFASLPKEAIASIRE